MQLQTQIHLYPTEEQINYSSKVLLLGSCFTENIGSKLDYFQFQNWQNPFGVIFNPISLLQLIKRAIRNDLFDHDDIFQHNEIWYSFQAHSSCSSLDANTLVTLLNEQLQLLKNTISECSHLMITLGSAWVYRHVESQQIVANCHKVPQQDFSKELLSVPEIEECLQQILAAIQNVNPEATLVFTVSPVRHIKDGMIANSQSKAHLIAAVQNTVTNTKAIYFPAYEVMMDDLREYRFYASDLIHPNEIAIHYIWEKFKQVWIDPDTASVQKEIDTIRKGLQHRPFHPKSKKHQVFLSSIQIKIEKLNHDYPHFIWE